jgi:hypothetical protein
MAEAHGSYIDRLLGKRVLVQLAEERSHAIVLVVLQDETNTNDRAKGKGK